MAAAIMARVRRIIAEIEPHATMLRFPDVSAEHIVFSYASDLWIVDREGGVARPLASPPGSEAFPRFSADGETIVFRLEDGNEVVFNDQRRFGLMTLVAGTAENDHPLLRHLAPDPLDNSFTSGSFLARLAGRRTPVKAALLNQEIVGGVGNIYASESLHQARISPRRLAAHIGPGRAAALADALGDVLHRAIAAGGSSLRDHVRTSGEPGYFQHDFRVYGRENDPCPTAGCAGIIRRIVQSGRSTYLCGHCQR